MEQVSSAAHRWRYAVILAELSVAAGCVYLGWNAVAVQPAAEQIRVRHAAVAAGPRAGAPALPVAAPGTGSSARSTGGHVLQAPNLTADWLSRLNADDYDLYRRQWQVLQLLMSGVRTYVEQNVVPRVLGK